MGWRLIWSSPWSCDMNETSLERYVSQNISRTTGGQQSLASVESEITGGQQSLFFISITELISQIAGQIYTIIPQYNWKDSRQILENDHRHHLRILLNSRYCIIWSPQIYLEYQPENCSSVDQSPVNYSQYSIFPWLLAPWWLAKLSNPTTSSIIYIWRT